MSRLESSVVAHPSHSTNEWTAERSFGRSVGSVLVLFGAAATIRGRNPILGYVLLATGLSLVLAASTVPRLLHPLNRWWMTLARGLSYVSTRVILAFVFFGAVLPISLIRKLTGTRPLGERRADCATYWQPYPERIRDPRHYDKQF
jgi:hypothetical protein